jgi:Fe-S cluster assembly protein SufB
MNTYAGGQFEHTLIIVDNNARGDYIEGCSAPKFDKKSLHAGLVEIFVGENSHMRYSSVENWSTNTYNLNTKRSIIEKNGYMEWINGNL